MAPIGVARADFPAPSRKPAADRLMLRSSDSRTMYGNMYDVANGDTPYSTCAGDRAHHQKQPISRAFSNAPEWTRTTTRNTPDKALNLFRPA